MDYRNDGRVSFKQADHCEVTKDGDIWDVVLMHNGWVAAPPTAPGQFRSDSDHGAAYDRWIASLPVYGSADDAIASVIGEPA